MGGPRAPIEQNGAEHQRHAEKHRHEPGDAGGVNLANLQTVHHISAPCHRRPEHEEDECGFRSARALSKDMVPCSTDKRVEVTRGRRKGPAPVCDYSPGQSMPISEGSITASPRVTRAQASAITTGIARSRAASP